MNQLFSSPVPDVKTADVSPYVYQAFLDDGDSTFIKGSLVLHNKVSKNLPNWVVFYWCVFQDKKLFSKYSI